MLETGKADAIGLGGKQQGRARKQGESVTPSPGSENQARHDKFLAREPGDLQLTLPGMMPVGSPGEAARRNPRMNESEKSDGVVVPEKPGNGGTSAGLGGGKDPDRRKPTTAHPHRTQGRSIGGTSALGRVREKARKEAKRQEKEKEAFTNLFTHLRIDLMRAVFYRLRKDAATGVDGQDWADYETDLESRLADLLGRLHRGAYKPPPVRRVYIPKADGKQRPLGIPTVEDKVVQGAMVAILTPIYEQEFLNCSYGFRPGRNQKQALQAVDEMMYGGKVNWVLDADIQAFFDRIDHDHLLRFVGHRVQDPRVLALIRRWLRAGVMEEGRRLDTEEGTPQGGLISPLLANIYLHYVLDLYFDRRLKRALRGEAYLVRYADDFIIGLQHEEEARAALGLLKERMEAFGLTLHPEKTRLIEFGRFARQDRAKKGERRPETFVFLGFTHICGESRAKKYQVVRKTAPKKLRNKLNELKKQMRERMHWRLGEQMEWLRSVLKGHIAYYAVPTNYKAVAAFQYWLLMAWLRTLARRSQRARRNRDWREQLLRRLRPPRIHIQPLVAQLVLPRLT